MLTYRVLVNGELVSTAGGSDMCVLNTILSSLGKLGATSKGTATIKDGMKIELHVGGLSSNDSQEEKRSVSWITKELKVGDKIIVEIVESDCADLPIQPRQPTPEDLEFTKAQIAKQEAIRFESAKKYYLENKHKYAT
jgi:hypothetical protein